jgi:hypothetical protein
MIRRNTSNVRRNVRSNERRSVITRRGARRLDNEAQMARRTRRFRRYEEDEKEEEVENLIDTAEISAIVDKAVDALAGYDCPEKEYDDEEKEELPENEAICVGEDEQEIPVSVDEENAKLVIELGDDATVEVALDQPEEDVDAELAESLEEYFNPEDEEDDDDGKEDDDKDAESAEERRVRRSMNRRLENFKRRQALRRREEAVKRFRRAQAIKRIREERNGKREETRRPAGRPVGRRVGRRVEGREETRRPRIGNLRRPGTRGRR